MQFLAHTNEKCENLRPVNGALGIQGAVFLQQHPPAAGATDPHKLSTYPQVDTYPSALLKVKKEEILEGIESQSWGYSSNYNVRTNKASRLHIPRQ